MSRSVISRLRQCFLATGSLRQVLVYQTKVNNSKARPLHHQAGSGSATYTAKTIRRQLRNGQRYRDEILRRLAVSKLQQSGPQAVLVDDNARPYQAQLVINCLCQDGVTTMGWESASPQLNPIGNFWDLLERCVSENHPPPQTLQQLLWLPSHGVAPPPPSPPGGPERAGGVSETSRY